MCGRFTWQLSPAELQEFFDLFRAPDVSPRYNIAPTQPVLTVSLDATGVRESRLRTWGLIPSWAKDPSIGSQLINARSESAAEKPAFRAAFRQRRCLIPASGFYEWETLNQRTKQPWYIALASGQPMALAGLWELWQDAAGAPLETCTILTTTANTTLADLHDRMPVLLASEQFGVWLDPAVDPAALGTLLAPCPDDWLTRVAVNPRVNNVHHDGPDCLEPVSVQRGLF
jgi:putative SOS response-associated peptidase YedK